MGVPQEEEYSVYISYYTNNKEATEPVSLEEAALEEKRQAQAQADRTALAAQNAQLAAIKQELTPMSTEEYAIHLATAKASAEVVAKKAIADAHAAMGYDPEEDMRKAESQKAHFTPFRPHFNPISTPH